MKKTASQQTEEKAKYKFTGTEYKCTKCGHIINVETDLKNTLDKLDIVCKCGCKAFKKITGETT